MKKRSYFYLSISILIMALALLISASPILLMAILEDPYLPAGTLITWLGLISLALSVKFGIGASCPKWMRSLILISMILAFSWGMICYLLSGNWAFNFSNIQEFQGGQTAMKIFWIFTYSVASIPILILLIHWVMRLISHLTKPR